MQEAALCIMNDTVPSATVDKSKNNNISTLKFYFNLDKNTICNKYAANGYFKSVVLNTIKKFQFPNTRTNTDLQFYKKNEQKLAPMREIVKILYLLTNFTSHDAYLTKDEIRYFVFYNDNIAKNLNYDLLALIKQILEFRQTGKMPDSIEATDYNTYWKFEERQLREMLKLLIWSGYINEDNNKFSINQKNLSQKDKADIFEITSYNDFWDPNSSINYREYMDMDEDININEEIERKSIMGNNSSLQQIYYGAPGTGKSHKIKKYFDDKSISTDNIFRTTFHPDSDYSTFVGAYKPTMKQQYRYESNIKVKYPDIDELANAKKDDPIIDNVITYQFIPQAFLQAYIRAYQTTDNVYLVIEEINRGNCAQIFGDLFQLLDRDDNGKSEYHIKADTDLCEFLKKKLDEDSEGIKDGELCLPPNLYIWATMNTSDQSLFPIDSAFKRRWDWEYIPIGYNNDLIIKIGNNNYSWTEFQKNVNDKIYKIDSSEDKKLGDFFVNPHNGIITADLLLNKILFYLWNDVCKDDPSEIFKIKTPQSEDDITFSGFFCPEKDVKLQELMAFLEVNPLNNDQQEAPETQTDEPIEDSNSNA
jgi:hypothetical protein